MPRPENIDFVIVHITASQWGSVESIRRMHINERGWADIGYHWVITNCYPTYESYMEHRPEVDHDGMLWPGRDLDHDGDIDEEIGAHAFGFNSRSIGVALIGMDGIFTSRQIQSLTTRISELQENYSIVSSHVIGHYETGNTSKSCPQLDMNWLRKNLLGSDE